jgi:hypothetical protein
MADRLYDFPSAVCTCNAVVFLVLKSQFTDLLVKDPNTGDIEWIVEVETSEAGKQF